MKQHFVSKWLNYFIAIVWIANGLFCKILNLVPRHQKIVAKILDNQYAPFLTLSIGIAETGMAIWILSGIWSRLNALVQIIIIAAMNVLEFILVPDLLLWGKFNIIFACMFMFLIYYKEFHFSKKLRPQPVCSPS